MTRKPSHRLQSIPGVGKVLALVLLYEIHDIRRFPEAGQFLSYARLVRCVHESAGKKQGTGGNKIGNAHLKWAFSEAACLFLAIERAGQEVAGTPGEEARQEAGAGSAGGTTGPGRLPPAAQEGGLRRATLLRPLSPGVATRFVASCREPNGPPHEPPARGGELVAELGQPGASVVARAWTPSGDDPLCTLTPQARTPDAWISPRRATG